MTGHSQKDTSENAQDLFNAHKLKTEELERTQKELETTNRERTKLQADIAGANQKIWDTEAMNRSLQAKNTKLRDIIIKSGNNDTESTDSVIIQQFSELRDFIQKIVHQHYSMEPQQLDVSRSSVFKRQKEFFRGDTFQRNIPDKVRRFRVRAKLFEILNTTILSSQCFGVGWETEQSLAGFELELRSDEKGR